MSLMQPVTRSDRRPDKIAPALAIVIPAFRVRHLGDALRSIAAQTDQRFTVYVGDDGSAEPLRELSESFRFRFDLRYHRFDTNLGGKNLVAHWHRCIALTANEPWLWLFSDDDVMEPECVAKFYQAIEQERTVPVDLFRFQLDQTNEHSAGLVRRSDHPAFEKCEDFLRALLSDPERAFKAQEHIFSRRIYEQHGGFIDFPKAIYSDHATWLCFAARHGVCTLAGPRVVWRSHPLGTSSGMREAHRRQWHEAAQQYVRWLADFSVRQGPEAVRIFQRAGRDFYFRELSRFRPVLTRAERQAASVFARQIFGGTQIGARVHLHYCLVHQKFIVPRLIKPYRGWKRARGNNQFVAKPTSRPAVM